MTSVRERRPFYNEKKKRVGNYILEDPLGEGSFGRVRYGLHIPTNEKVAVKILTKRVLVKKEVARRSLRREGNILQKIDHPNIIKVFEAMETRTCYYLIFELADGGSFLDFLIKKRCLLEEEAVLYIREIVSAVDHIHTSGIVHRDLRLENFLLDSNGHIKITGFGLSMLQVESSAPRNRCGSPAYAAPEVFCNRTHGTGVDIWSIGVCLYAMLIGHLPFLPAKIAASLPELHTVILKGVILPTYLTKDCHDLISRMLKPLPSERIIMGDILQHKWLVKGFTPTVPRQPPISKMAPLAVDPKLTQFISYVCGYRQDDITHAVRQRQMSQISATYHLLARSVRDGFRIPELSELEFSRHESSDEFVYSTQTQIMQEYIENILANNSTPIPPIHSIPLYKSCVNCLRQTRCQLHGPDGDHLTPIGPHTTAQDKPSTQKTKSESITQEMIDTRSSVDIIDPRQNMHDSGNRGFDNFVQADNENPYNIDEPSNDLQPPNEITSETVQRDQELKQDGAARLNDNHQPFNTSSIKDKSIDVDSFAEIPQFVKQYLNDSNIKTIEDLKQLSSDIENAIKLPELIVAYLCRGDGELIIPDLGAFKEILETPASQEHYPDIVIPEKVNIGQSVTADKEPTTADIEHTTSDAVSTTLGIEHTKVDAVPTAGNTEPLHNNMVFRESITADTNPSHFHVVQNNDTEIPLNDIKLSGDSKDQSKDATMQASTEIPIPLSQIPKLDLVQATENKLEDENSGDVPLKGVSIKPRYSQTQIHGYNSSPSPDPYHRWEEDAMDTTRASNWLRDPYAEEIWIAMYPKTIKLGLPIDLSPRRPVTFNPPLSSPKLLTHRQSHQANKSITLLHHLAANSGKLYR